MKNSPKRNIKGLRFGYLAVFEYLGNSRWDCICTKCNRHVLKRQSDLESGRTIMCDGCLLDSARREKE